MTAFFWLIDRLIGLYIWVLIIAAVFSLLTAFNVLDTRNRLVWTIGDFLWRVTEPALRPIRRILPNLGGVDLSPLVLILLLQALQIFLSITVYPAMLRLAA
ncbi:YggT family protein [Roseomonas sp. SSH11]|uniref:YggT family protein n=1 Tax=Pararoseomonas baculiformis TaxID=2820812 RepID=A0ABS4A8I3_9PROT|nr:YggT family protein [Pararoseomonas baculiformis]MBP0443310.1 YggT family protein [Pararoseomonas baculiformis]